MSEEQEFYDSGGSWSDRTVRRFIVGGLAFLLIAFVAASMLSDDSGGVGRPGDASARAACGHFHNVAVDYTDGVLTREELRGKLRQVNDTAQASEVAAVREAAREMFAAVTSGTQGEFDAAVRSMSSACDPYRGG